LILGNYKYNLILILMILILSSSKISFSSILTESNLEKKTFFVSVIDELIKEGVDTAFINRTIEHPNTTFNERYVKINVNNFASKPDYSHNYSRKSINKTVQFINNYNDILHLAELNYGVPKEIIASILFIETRHGEFLGNNNLLSVYYSTALCNQAVFVAKNKEALKESFVGTEDELEQLMIKIDVRSEKKAKWAIQQLKALSEIEKNSKLAIYDLNGSWAGAFGMSQFIPTSYLSWAVDGNNDGSVNLFETTDAIFSVANYLKSNGWNSESESNRKAVFHYNNSTAYVDAVFKLADLSATELENLSNQSAE